MLSLSSKILKNAKINLLRTSEMAKPYIILVIGLPGTGKTTLSRLLSNKLQIPLITTENIRNELFPEEVNYYRDYDFTQNQLDIVYQTVYLIAKYLSFTFYSYIIDGVYRSKTQRDPIKNIATTSNRNFYGIHFICSEEEAIRRLKFRKIEGNISPAGINTYYKIAKEYEKVDNDSFLIFDTTNKTPKTILTEIMEKMNE